MTQAALLPSGTYKETMRNKLLDILYVPAYLEGHFFLKALFAAVYVLSFRASDFIRIPMLLLVNISLLLLNMREHPCAIQEINTLRSSTLAGTVWAGSASLLFVTQLQVVVGGWWWWCSCCLLLLLWISFVILVEFVVVVVSFPHIHCE
jgi:hypothetical protein